MPKSDGASESEGGDLHDIPDSEFSKDADEECVFCSKVTEKKTAQMLYASQEWDYYYCYRCRAWFKRYYGDEKVVLPVVDKRDVRQLTWTYVSRMERLQVQNRLSRRMRGAWVGLERRFLQ